ncbi:Bug family tripartite tricarboxylate transporter substrate binding protein [Paralcaligenes ureilyticus]|uniref:Tripartite-type tricarboxylate transporter receptor subunit TctC n=1 Tax=Paralcaligenes ureilyticus TaxID=627131 RepID=A0A4R3M1Y1_9BURK|nr:tripartite tricarboxylate transporter substrate binding protein [Paralcaligenes ureilyticus]TCT07141.1 tripartite-type tricarboxylate transporter receptor subunit TctC [Paralcaligenes ureilyticus]
MKSQLLVRDKLFKILSKFGAMVLGTATVLSLPFNASAQNFPNKALKIIVPYSPGGGTDGLARIIAKGMADNLGQSIVVENRPGAGGTIGAAAAANAPADGYTLLILNAVSHTSSAGLYRHLSYDPIKSFSGIGSAAETPYVIVSGPSLKVKTFKDFVALARTKPGAINYASSGIGGVSHLTTELFKSIAKVDLRHVPYKGDGPAVTDLLGGFVDVDFGNVLAMLPFIKTGKLSALAVTSEKRLAVLPDVPTVAESGYPSYVASGEFGFAVPAGTPPAVISRLNLALTASVKSPKISELLKIQGVEPKTSTPAEFDALMRRESAKWLGVIHDIGIKAQ